MKLFGENWNMYTQNKEEFFLFLMVLFILLYSHSSYASTLCKEDAFSLYLCAEPIKTISGFCVLALCALAPSRGELLHYERYLKVMSRLLALVSYNLFYGLYQRTY